MSTRKEGHLKVFGAEFRKGWFYTGGLLVAVGVMTIYAPVISIGLIGAGTYTIAKSKAKKE